ncbi:MAG: transketolase family protein [Acidimicrobiia bacterium]
MTVEMSQALRVTFGETVAELANSDPRIVVVDGDLGSSTRADIFEEAHPDRFYQMGVAEQNMLGVAAGMATLGLIPFVSTFACFAVARALDPIRVLIAQPNLPVKIMGGYAGLLAGMTGKTHLMFDDVSIMRAMPHMTVVAPADDVEARQALGSIVDDEGPTYMRLTRQEAPRLFDQNYQFDLGDAVVLREGDDVTLISSGVQSVRVAEAAEILAAEGVDAYVLHVPTIKPMDIEAVVAAAERTGFVVTVEEHTIIGGLGGAVAEVLAEHSPTRMRRHGIMDIYGESGPDDALLEKYRLSSSQVATVVRKHLDERAG